MKVILLEAKTGFFCMMIFSAVNKEQAIRNWVLLSLAWFLLVASMGLLLRYIMVWPVEGFVYGNILHSHSHLAFLGWMYGGIYTLLVKNYIPQEKIKFYNDLFWFTQIAVVGMIVTFAWQAYGLYSITFSSLHMLLAYFFVYRFYKDTKNQKRDAAFLFSLTALFLMVISTLGPWSLGMFGALKAGTKSVMDLLINFYLHFQINGWFIFAVTGLFLFYLKNAGINCDEKNLRNYFYLMLLSVIPAYALSAVWVVQDKVLFAVAVVAAIIQLIALSLFMKEIYKSSAAIKNRFSFVKNLILFIFILFIGKNILQLISAIPDVAIVVSKIRLLVISYLHLVLLGICSLFLIVAYAISGYYMKNYFFTIGIVILISGIILTELLMFSQVFYFITGSGTISHYNQILFYLSLLMPSGICLILVSAIQKWKAISKFENLNKIPEDLIVDSVPQ